VVGASGALIGTPSQIHHQSLPVRAEGNLPNPDVFVVESLERVAPPNLVSKFPYFYIGATGMQMMELSGEIADGVVLNYLVSPDYNVRAIEALSRGLSKSGRSLDDIDRPQLVVCSVHEDRAVALDMARLMVTQYLGQQPHIMKASGVPDSLLDEIGKVLTWPATHDEVVAASKLVPDDIVQMITASGTADECRAKVAEYVDSGATCPILYPLGDDVHAMIDAFATA